MTAKLSWARLCKNDDSMYRDFVVCTVYAPKRRFSELRSCVKVEVAVLGFPSLIILMVCSVDVKQHLKKKTLKQSSGAV